MSNCVICQNRKEKLIFINEKYLENDNILVKLQQFVPEVDWKPNLTFCAPCLEQLQGIFAFREKCIKALSKTIIKEVCYSDVDEPVKTPERQNCHLCETTFSNKYLLKRHLNNVHATEKKHKCDLCDQKFVSMVYLKAHKRYHIGDRSHICSFCGKGFITTSDLYHHEKIHANKRAYRCETCPKAFNTSSDLHKHKICVHSDRNQWKYVCQYCNRRFPLKINLDGHIKTHTGEKNFSCHLCGRKFINNSVLMRHIETHSNTTSFKCEICLQSYKYKKSLELHQAKIHSIGTIPEQNKQFFCHICAKTYIDSHKLEKHIRVHTGERPFQCPNCAKTFIDKSYVTQHLKSCPNLT